MFCKCLNGKCLIKNVFLFSISVIMFGCTSPQVDISLIEISEIVVLDSNFNRVRVVNDFEQLQEINKLWQQLEQVDKLPDIAWTHKLDIRANQLSGRWLYNKNGYLAKLNYQLKPMYQVEDPAAFNKIILAE